MGARTPADYVWLPVDVLTLKDAQGLIDVMWSVGITNFKVGLALITSGNAPAVVRYVKRLGGKVWYDGKFDDKPKTIKDAARAASETLGVDMFNIHASCGSEAIRAAADNKGSAKLLVVTVLTSLSFRDVVQLWYPKTLLGSIQHILMNVPEEQALHSIQEIVLNMSIMACLSGADGVVCSPLELEVLGSHPALDSALKVTPGIRPKWCFADDHKRFMTPASAIRAGATDLVIGEPITDPPPSIGTPIDAAKRIFDEIGSSL